MQRSVITLRTASVSGIIRLTESSGKIPCKGTKIEKGDLRMGTWVEIKGNGSFKWRHWGCVLSPAYVCIQKTTRSKRLIFFPGVTEVQLQHWHADFSEASEVDGCECTHSSRINISGSCLALML